MLLLEGSGQGCTQTSYDTQQRIIWSKMSIALRLRNPYRGNPLEVPEQGKETTEVSSGVLISTHSFNTYQVPAKGLAKSIIYTFMY